MEFSLETSGQILARTPSVLRTLLAGLPETLACADYGPGTWSPHEIVGHLIHGEQTDWIPRARLILEQGEAVVFESFDRQGHRELCSTKSLNELLDLFGSLRATNLEVLRSLPLTPDSLSRRGRHPEFGPVTLGQHLASWVVHDLNHIAQTCKAMAFQHRLEVGPWKAYLSILTPTRPR